MNPNNGNKRVRIHAHIACSTLVVARFGMGSFLPQEPVFPNSRADSKIGHWGWITRPSFPGLTNGKENQLAKM